MTQKAYLTPCAMASFLALVTSASAETGDVLHQAPGPDWGLIAVVVALATLAVIVLGIFWARRDARDVADAIKHAATLSKLEGDPR